MIMSMDLKKFMFLFAGLLTCMIFLARENEKIKEGLDSCIENVQKKCGPVIQYASELERENARLRKLLKKCNQ